MDDKERSLDFSQYLSPFTWRYGSEDMRHIFSEEHKHELWRRIWVSLAEAEHEAGLVSAEELQDLLTHQGEVDITRIHELEKETKHDVVAAIREFAEKARVGGGKIHLGATSMDIVDNADAIRTEEGLRLLEGKVTTLLSLFAHSIEPHADIACMGYTHLQPAEPTTVGYRLAVYAQDVLTDYHFLEFVRNEIAGKGMKGAVGTRASYVEILEGTGMSAEELDAYVSRKLGINSALISTQVYPRKYDYLVMSFLASLASSLGKFAGDVRMLQSPGIGEWAEPFGKKQVGSSAMPFKKNPMNSEKICSLARYVEQLPVIALQNATHSYLERTLDDSANKRVIVPEAFLAVDEMLDTATKILDGLVIHEARIAYNLGQYAPFAATETLLVMLVKKGANRQEMHEVLRDISLASWEAVSQGKVNPMTEKLLHDRRLRKHLSQKEITSCFDVSRHIGDAPTRARKLAEEIKKIAG